MRSPAGWPRPFPSPNQAQLYSARSREPNKEEVERSIVKERIWTIFSRVQRRSNNSEKLTFLRRVMLDALRFGDVLWLRFGFKSKSGSESDKQEGTKKHSVYFSKDLGATLHLWAGEKRRHVAEPKNSQSGSCRKWHVNFPLTTLRR